VWEAATAACKAGHGHVLRWIFSSGWPSQVDGDLPWHLLDILDEGENLWPDAFRTIQWTIAHPGRLEFELYMYALQTEDAACLEALLDAGCRSPWICVVAAYLGKATLLNMATDRGCRFNHIVPPIDPRHDSLDLLQAVCRNKSSGDPPGDISTIINLVRRHFKTAYRLAAESNNLKRLDELLRTYQDVEGIAIAAIWAAHYGHVEFLQKFER
jgi:hypothetical protein